MNWFDVNKEGLAKIRRFGAPGGPRPRWLGDARFHASHRAALLAKAPEHYGAFGWRERPAIAYRWPVESY